MGRLKAANLLETSKYLGVSSGSMPAVEPGVGSFFFDSDTGEEVR
jgi:hypothetical protein